MERHTENPVDSLGGTMVDMDGHARSSAAVTCAVGDSLALAREAAAVRDLEDGYRSVSPLEHARPRDYPPLPSDGLARRQDLRRQIYAAELYASLPVQARPAQWTALSARLSGREHPQ